MLIDALHAALEDAVEALKIVRVYVAAHVFIRAVHNEFMTGKILLEVSVLTRLVGHDRCLLRNVRLQDRNDMRCASVVDMEGADLPRITIQKGQDGALVVVTALNANALAATLKRLIAFDGTAAASERNG